MGIPLKKTNSSHHSDDALFHLLQNDKEGFKALAKILESITGISMDDSQVNLVKVANRLGRILSKRKLQNYSEYLKLLESRDTEIFSEFISALTTHTTSFFREASQFESFKSLLPELIQKKKQKNQSEIRIWSAACSTGEEAYTIAMILHETLPKEFITHTKILATDIDNNVVQNAIIGKYPYKDIKKIPSDYIEKYFQKTQNAAKEEYQVKEEVKNLLRFATFNLSVNNYPFNHPFDIIFCKNVLIYFNKEQAQSTVKKTINALDKDGLLFVGHSEVGYIRTPEVKMVKFGVYRKV